MNSKVVEHFKACDEAGNAHLLGRYRELIRRHDGLTQAEMDELYAVAKELLIGVGLVERDIEIVNTVRQAKGWISRAEAIDAAASESNKAVAAHVEWMEAETRKMQAEKARLSNVASEAFERQQAVAAARQTIEELTRTHADLLDGIQGN